jgi:hypothetical protein
VLLVRENLQSVKDLIVTIVSLELGRSSPDKTFESGVDAQPLEGPVLAPSGAVELPQGKLGSVPSVWTKLKAHLRVSLLA